MDELTLLRSFRAERVRHDPASRDAARRALEARFGPAPAATRPERRGLFVGRRRPLLALASAAVAAAAVAAVLVLGSGSTAQPAAAAVLRQTAAVAAEADGPTGIPGPGQFLYQRVERTELQEWIPGCCGGTASGDLASNAATEGGGEGEGPFTAEVPWEEEVWTNTAAHARTRWVIGAPRFLSGVEESRWEAAGSPLPDTFDGDADASDFPESKILESRRGVLDVEGRSGAGFRDFSSLPTEPRALRIAIEARQGAGSPDPAGASKPVDDGQVIAELWDILDKPNGTRALRAAIFGALAEEPGIELNRDAEDLVGRPGYALRYVTPEGSRSGYQLPGFGVEYIFDPETSEVLGKREFVADPAALPWPKRPPAGTVIRENADLQSEIVGSTRERPRGGS